MKSLQLGSLTLKFYWLLPLLPPVTQLLVLFRKLQLNLVKEFSPSHTTQVYINSRESFGITKYVPFSFAAASNGVKLLCILTTGGASPGYSR